MKRLTNIFAVCFSILLLSSCGDSPDKLMDDQVSWIKEMTDTLNDVADGKISSSKATQKIKTLGKQGEKFVERKTALNKSASPEQLVEAAKEHSKETGQAFRGYMEAVSKLSASGRMTRELADAIENMKTP